MSAESSTLPVVAPLTTAYVAVAADREAAAPLVAVLPAATPDADVTVLPALGWPIERVAPLVAAALRPETVVLLDGSQPARDLAGWLAVAAGARVVWSVESVTPEPDGLVVRRIVNGGEGRLVERIPRDAGPLVLLTRTGAAARPAGPPGAGPVPLPGAALVVCVGRGIGGPQYVDLFRRLADALGAALGATRAVVDLGWLPFDRQIGQTGVTVAPRLYLGFGVSGAVQHRVGMRDSDTVIAVNSDRHADLCALADVVVEGDAVAVARTLLSQLEDLGESPA